MKTIKINNQDYPIKFTVSVVKRYAQSLGMKTMDEFQEWISNMNPNDFDSIDKMCGLFLMAFNKGCKNEGVEFPFDGDDIIDLMSDQPEVFNDLMLEFARSQESEPVEVANQSGEETDQKKSQ